MAERLPETCRVVRPIKLEFSASVGFIYKEKGILSLEGGESFLRNTDKKNRRRKTGDLKENKHVTSTKKTGADGCLPSVI